MLAMIRRLCQHEDGTTAVEYALLLSLIVLVVAVGASLVGTSVSAIFNRTATTIDNATPSLPLPP